VAGPDKAGRGAAYGESHLRQIRQVRRFQEEGLTLSEIAHRLAAPAASIPRPESDAWRHFNVADDLVLMVREQAAPWRLRQIHRAMAQLRDSLNQPNNKEEVQS
jgi:DNA-binding transcriptional MerR regulator